MRKFNPGARKLVDAELARASRMYRRPPRLLDRKAARGKPAVQEPGPKAIGGAVIFDRYEPEPLPRMLEADPTVVSYADRDLPQVEFLFRGEERVHTPDLAVRFTDGSREVLDYLTSDEVAHPVNAAVLPILRDAYRRLGWRYRVWTDSDLSAQPARDNAELLRWARARTVSSEDECRILRAGAGAASLGGLLAALEDLDEAREKVLALAGRGKVLLETARAPIGPSTRLLGIRS